MATYGNYSYGSRGDDVKKLQEALNKSGYNLDTDGIFGNQTQAAVRDYQQKNGLTVDGIAGQNTLSKLYEGTAYAATPVKTTTSAEDPTKPISASSYGQALQALNNSKTNAPIYANTYGQQVQDAYNAIVNRDKFSYDVNSDMLYNQYKDQYTRQGKLAMQDTMGQAAALTGGYGSTYGQSVGQQQYDAYLQKLNDVIPDLYNSAYNRYQQEGNDLQTQYSLLRDLENNDYSRYMDQYNKWATEREYLTQQANQAYARQQDSYNNLYSLISSTGYNPTDEELENAGMSRAAANALLSAYQQALAAASSGGGRSGGSSRSSGGSSLSLTPIERAINTNNDEAYGEVFATGVDSKFKSVQLGVENLATSGKSLSYIENYVANRFGEGTSSYKALVKYAKELV